MKRVLFLSVIAIVSMFSLAGCEKNDDEPVNKSNIKPNGMENYHAYIEMGLSVKWATWNVGADSPGDYGDYFAWGMTRINNSYNWRSYQYCIQGESDHLTRYCTNSDFGYNHYSDNDSILFSDDDVAHVKWGGAWRMPTNKEWQELLDNCKWEWCAKDNTEFGGIAGWKVTSNVEGYKDRFIFLPAAGYKSDSYTFEVSTCGYYWSSLLYKEIPTYANCLFFDSGKKKVSTKSRHLGSSVRPVCP